MNHFKSNVRDLEFDLFDVLEVDRTWKTVAKGDDAFDRDLATAILSEANRWAAEALAPSFASAGPTSVVLDPESGVHLDPTQREALERHLESGWMELDMPAEITGRTVPHSLRWAVTELMMAANPAVMMGMSITPPTVELLLSQGTAEQRRVAELIAARKWTCTMVLTEPDAGSDVGLARTTAEPCADGSWSIRGTKRFITFGDHDAAENIIHLVLARPKGVPGIGGPGSRGLSLFVVPKYHFDADGVLGDRNGVTISAIEHKMGLYGSPTCEMDFGSRGVPATGWLLGDSHQGLRQMFDVIRHLRMMTGAKALGALSTGYLNALSFAKDRIQGSPVDDPRGEPIPIIGHPDVRRSLLAQKAYTEGIRLLILYTATVMEAADGSSQGPSSSVHDRQALLLPIVKGYSSEMAFRVLGNESLQLLGGSGYLRDYPIEQYVRDTKIDAIYEGTTGIQGLDLFRRQILRDHGRTVHSFIADAVDNWVPSVGEFDVEAELFKRGAIAVDEMVDQLIEIWEDAGESVGGPSVAAQGTTPLLFALGDLVVGGLLLRAAGAATAARLDGSPEQEFLEGKCAAARWFLTQVVSRLDSTRASMNFLDERAMRMPLSSF